LFQRTVKDARTGKVVEGEGGVRVLASPMPSELSSSSSSAAKSSSRTESESVVGKRGAVRAALLSGEGQDAVATTDDSSAIVDDVDDADANALGLNKYDPLDKHRKASFGDNRPTRVTESGWDLLDNNDVNFLMAFFMSLGAMGIASWYWGVPIQNAFQL
jgi:hypothetical protein